MVGLFPTAAPPYLGDGGVEAKPRPVGLRRPLEVVGRELGIVDVPRVGRPEPAQQVAVGVGPEAGVVGLLRGSEPPGVERRHPGPQLPRAARR